jgi:hypothetical protein
MEQNEQELIAQILDGDEDAYATLIDRYKEGLYPSMRCPCNIAPLYQCTTGKVKATVRSQRT